MPSRYVREGRPRVLGVKHPPFGILLAHEIEDARKMARREYYGVIVVRVHDGRIDVCMILPTYSKDQWEFPKGGFEKIDNNLPRVCACRELKEETGLIVSPDKLSEYMYSVPQDVSARVPILCGLFVHFVDTKQRIKIGDIGEIRDCRWIDSFSPQVRIREDFRYVLFLLQMHLLYAGV